MNVEFESRVNSLLYEIRELTPEVFLKANLSIAFAAMATEQAFDKMFRKYVLNHKRFLTLHTLLENGGSMSMPEITSKMHVSRQAIALAARVFENQGLISRTVEEKDRRIIRVTLTEKGLELIREIALSEYRKHVHNILMSVVNEREAMMLTDILDSLAEKLSSISIEDQSETSGNFKRRFNTVKAKRLEQGGEKDE